MQRGHVTGTKRERTPAAPWWAEAEERRIQAVEREWAEKDKHTNTEDGDNGYNRQTRTQ